MPLPFGFPLGSLLTLSPRRVTLYQYLVSPNSRLTLVFMRWLATEVAEEAVVTVEVEVEAVEEVVVDSQAPTLRQWVVVVVGSPLY